MIKAEQITQLLERYTECISGVETNPEGFVRARLVNRIDSSQPYYLIVDPIEEKLILRVLVCPITKIRHHSQLFRDLARANSNLRCGCVGADGDGGVTFQLNHVCAGDDGQPSPELIERLLDESIEATRYIEKVVLFGSMVEAGIPHGRANQIVKTLLGDDQEAQTSNQETL